MTLNDGMLQITNPRLLLQSDAIKKRQIFFDRNKNSFHRLEELHELFLPKYFNFKIRKIIVYNS